MTSHAIPFSQHHPNRNRRERRTKPEPKPKPVAPPKRIARAVDLALSAE